MSQWQLNAVFLILVLVTGGVNTESAPPVVSTPNDGSFCPGEEVVFYCQVVGTERLVWNSSKYIGEGGAELAFGTVSPTGVPLAIKPIEGTYALVVSTNETEGKINSSLHIRIQFNGTVSCIADPPGLMTNITISIVDTPSCQLGGMVTTTNGEDSTTVTTPSAEPPTTEPETVGTSSAPSFFAASLTVYIMTGAMVIIYNSYEGS